ncbi:MAG: hypothetical protein F6K47_29890 [Symploca sp. SIO2E6]|nr:hypothetical protein [Symploca sp. SIO2E6]
MRKIRLFFPLSVLDKSLDIQEFQLLLSPRQGNSCSSCLLPPALRKLITHYLFSRPYLPL